MGKLTGIPKVGRAGMLQGWSQGGTEKTPKLLFGLGDASPLNVFPNSLGLSLATHTIKPAKWKSVLPNTKLRHTYTTHILVPLKIRSLRSPGANSEVGLI